MVQATEVSPDKDCSACGHKNRPPVKFCTRCGARFDFGALSNESVRAVHHSFKRSSPSTKSYKAFISYSHAADGKLAPALQNGLCRFANPWYRRRAIHVFRDTSNLAVSPHLWSSIEAALEQSEYLLLLASPEGARSAWVPRELDTFLRQNPSEKILLLLTDGEIVWDPNERDFDWSLTTAFPRLERKLFSEEPLWEDLRWAHREEHLDVRNPKFRNTIASVSATLRNIPLDDLVGEDIRELKQRRRAVWSAVAALLALAIFLAVFWRRAIVERDIAEARQLAASADDVRGTDVDALDLSALLAIESEHLSPVFENDLALRRVLALLPRTEKEMTPGDRIRSVAFSPDGRYIATGTESNTARVFEAETARELRWSTQGASVAFSPVSAYLATASKDRTVRMIDIVSGKQLWRKDISFPAEAVVFRCPAI